MWCAVPACLWQPQCRLWVSDFIEKFQNVDGMIAGGCEAELAKVGDLVWQNLVKGCLAPRELLTQKQDTTDQHLPV